MHGLANISGAVAFLTNVQVGFFDHPWVFSNIVKMRSLIGRLFGLLWLLSVIGLVASGLGIIFQQDWWRTMAILACAVSMIAIIPWWKTVPPGARFGAIFDLLVIVVLLSPLGQTITDGLR
jgi:hypothetical protein